MAISTLPRNRISQASPEAPEVTLAKSVLEHAGYSVRKNEKGRSFCHFLNCIREKDERTLDKMYRTGYEVSKGVTKAAMGEESGTVGGYLVPPDYTLQLMDVVSEEAFIYPRANVVPMASAEEFCPKVDVETAQSAGTAPYFGGMKFKWGSSQAPTETEPTWRSLSLKAWDLLGYADVSNQWLGDIGQRGEDYLFRIFGRAAAWYAEYAFLQGTGSAQLMPLGIISAPATIFQTRATASTIKLADIVGMTSSLLPYSWKNAIWATHPSCLAKIQNLDVSTYFINIELMEQRQGSQVGMLSTRPLFVTDKLPALGNAGDLVLFDPSLYVIGDRQQVLIDISEHNLFQTNQTVFRVWLRMDGKPALTGKVTLTDGTQTASGFVALSK